MKKILLAVALVACNSNHILGPTNLNKEGKFLHPIRLTSSPCVNNKYNLTVDWAIYGDNDWTATFRKATSVVSEVRNLSSTKASGCVYSLNDNAVVLITPNGALAVRQANDSASTVIK